jgi:sigma-B regulation protein RsbU (phosphoserine phosphatase)
MRYKRELEIGRDIQLSFLPERLPAPDGWELAADYRPALEVAGDFYDAMILPHGHLGLVIADVVGKGVTAALFMAIIRSLYRALFQQYYLFRADPAEVANPYAAAPIPFSFVDYEALLNAVRLTNSYLINNHRDSHIFATIFCGLLYPDSGRLLYVNAGHNPPFLLGRLEGGRRTIREQLAPTGPAIGLLADPIYRLSEARLAPGDMLFAYTDGIIETRDPGGEDFGLERLAAILTAQTGGAGEAIEAVKTAVRDHMTGAEPFDDMTMLALRRLPSDELHPGAA